MFTVIETPAFQKQAAKVWSEDERLEFIAWLAQNPNAGDVIPGAEGARKVRWEAKSQGSRGGARVIYFALTKDELLLLISVYAKNQRSNITPKEIKKASKS